MPDDLTIRIKKSLRGSGLSQMAAALERMGLRGKMSHEKFIPKAYLLAPVHDRIALLQGLCDTDGFVTDARTGIEYTTTSPRLRDDIAFLVGSLGGRATWLAVQGRYRADGEVHEARIAFRMHLSFPRGDVVPVSSTKHLALWRGGPSRLRERYVKAIEPAGEAMCRCIAIDSHDHLYVTDDFIVTHNTSFACNVACNICEAPQDNDPHGACYDPTYEHVENAVFFWSGEMPRDELVLRMACAEARVTFNLARRAQLTSGEWQALYAAAAWINSLPLWIDDTPGITLAELQAKVRDVRSQWARPAAPEKQQRERALGAVMVDYLTLMRGTGSEHNREQEVAGCSRGLKEMAKTIDVPVIALCQLNRANEIRGKDRRPQLSDLRESGQIEQDGDFIAFLHRPEYYDPGNEDLRGIAEMIIRKQRSGERDTVYLHFDGPNMRFSTITRDQAERINDLYKDGPP